MQAANASASVACAARKTGFRGVKSSPSIGLVSDACNHNAELKAVKADLGCIAEDWAHSRLSLHRSRRSAILEVIVTLSPIPDSYMAQKEANCSLGKRAVLYDIDAPFLGMICVPRRRILTKPLPNTFVQNRQTCFVFCTKPSITSVIHASWVFDLLT
jgi:hypothetical protein